MCDKGHLPVVAFSLHNHAKFTLFELADKLRNRGWIVPAYNCPKGADDMVSELVLLVYVDIYQRIAVDGFIDSSTLQLCVVSAHEINICFHYPYCPHQPRLLVLVIKVSELLRHAEFFFILL